MEKNIMVTTLSAIRNKNVDEMVYTEYDGELSVSSKFTNETGIKYLNKKLDNKLEVILAFATQEVREGETVDILKSRLDENNMSTIETVFLDNKISNAFISIYEMFNLIKEYKGKYPKDDICVHVDMTGGLRHSAMLMLGLIRLLKYNNIKTGYVIYINYDDKKVENASELLDMYSIIGGAEEFVSYGTVDQLSEYYNANDAISKELKEFLLALMKTSESFKTCVQQNKMKENLRSLKNILNKYKEINDRNNSSEIFIKLLISNIEDSYDELFKLCEKNDFVIGLIKWCMKKKMMQQAVTFFVEYMPIYILENKTISISALLEADVREKNKNKKYEPWQGFLFKNYRNDNDPNINKSRKVVFRELIYSNNIDVDKNVGIESFLSFVDKYMDIVKKHRNPINHANYDMQNINAVDKLKNDILAAFKKLKIKN